MVPLTLGWAIRSPELAAAVECCARGLPVRAVLRQVDLGEPFLRQVRAMHPDVVLVEAANSGALASWVERLKAISDPPLVMAVEPWADTDGILAAFRAGADDFLHPPIEEKLRAALARASERSRRRQEQSEHPGRILGVLSSKGGCGGTTVACGLAMALARRAAPGVLLLDADFRAGLLGFLTGVRSPHSIADAMANLHRLDLDYWQALAAAGPAGLHVITACLSGGFRRGTDAEALRRVFQFARAHYPWTLADLGSGLSDACRAVLDETDLLYLVTTTDVLALFQSIRTLQGLEAAGVKRGSLRLVANQVTNPPAMTQAEVERALGLPVEAMLPNDRGALERWHAGEHSLDRLGALGRRFTEMAAALAGAPENDIPARTLWQAAFGLLHPLRRSAVG